jgi:hypothetical protein
MVLDGTFHEVVDEAISDYGYNLLAIQLPTGSRTISKSLLTLLGTAKSAVLVMKQRMTSMTR